MSKLTLKFSKKEIDFSLGLGFLGEVLEVLDISIGELGEKMVKNPFKFVPAIMFESAKYQAGNEFEFTMPEFVEFLDNNGGIFSPAVQQFQLKLMESFTKDVPSEDQDVEPSDEPKKNRLVK